MTGTGVGRYRYDIMIGLVCLAASVAVSVDWFHTLDDGLRDLRFGASMRPATGTVVLVDVDSASIEALGELPWPRAHFADLVDKIMDAGAAQAVLGINLAVSAGPEGDAVLAQAIADAGGRVHPAAHLGLRWTPEGLVRGIEMPLALFTQAATPALIDDALGISNHPHEYRTQTLGAGGPLVSAGALLAARDEPIPARFAIDFGIDIQTVPRMSAADILLSDGPVAGLEGAYVYLAASTTAAGVRATDTPQGMISTGELQVLAAESIRQDRMLTPLGGVPVIAILIGVGAVLALMRRRLTLAGAIAGAVAYSALLEFLALALQVHAGLLLDTAAVHVAQVGFLFAAFAHELDRRSRSVTVAARERDSMRGILTRIVADNFDGVVVVDRTFEIRAASRLAEDLIAPSLVGQRIDRVLPEVFRKAIRCALDGTCTGGIEETTITCADGAPRLVEYVVTLSDAPQEAVADPDAGVVVCLTFRDVTERHHVQERLAYLASHDPTTGAASRLRLIEIAQSLVDTPAGRRRGLSLLLVTPSRLKTVNDTLGHAHGDMLLREIVERLRTTDAACVARLEGNGFALLRAGTLGEDEARAYADHVLAMLAEPYNLDGHYALIGCNAGMTDTIRSGHAPDALIAHANMALSVATDLPGDNWAMFTPEMDTRVKHKQEMEIALRAALSNDEFGVHYQPQVDLETGEIFGVEALARWQHPDLGHVSPAMFIPAAEETGLIIELGRWVLRNACREAAAWPKPVALSVNVSPMQFEYGDVVADVRAALASSGLAPERLTIEITESLLITETSRFTRQLETLRADGLKVALDDFGTGYSSLSYLGRLPVDQLKIDQSFVRGLPDDAEATAIVRAVLMLSESLGKEVVAEGIETADQAWMLRLAGCRIGQGYHFGRPVAAGELVALLTADSEDRMSGARVPG